MVRLVIGTCGFQRARKLHYENMDALEVQQTFYDPRMGKTFATWRREAPESFEFTVKAWMLVSHEYNRNLWARLRQPVTSDVNLFGHLKVNEATLWAWNVTLEAAEILKARVIVVQTPPSFRYSRANFEGALKFFNTIERKGRLIVWEPRGDWWDNFEHLKAIAFESGVLIGGDVLRNRMPPRDQGILYARLHGLGSGEVNYKYKYTEEDLARLAFIVEGFGAKEAYIMFNNVYSYDDALRFKTIISRGG